MLHSNCFQMTKLWFLFSGCMLTCDNDFCNGASRFFSDSRMDALLLTVAICMAATHIVVSIMYGFDPFDTLSLL